MELFQIFREAGKKGVEGSKKGSKEEEEASPPIKQNKIDITAVRLLWRDRPRQVVPAGEENGGGGGGGGGIGCGGGDSDR